MHECILANLQVEYGKAVMAPYGVVIAQPREQTGERDPDTGAMLPPVVRMQLQQAIGSKDEEVINFWIGFTGRLIEQLIAQLQLDLEDLRRLASGMEEVVAENQVLLQHEAAKQAIDEGATPEETKERVRCSLDSILSDRSIRVAVLQTEAARRMGLLMESAKSAQRRKQLEKQSKQSLADMENQLIRGVDARHQLMAKLMRKNAKVSIFKRSSMIV